MFRKLHTFITRARTVAVAAAAVAAICVGGANALAQDRPGTAKIINGSDVGATLPERWDFIAAVVRAGEPNSYDGQFCGGSLITPTLVLTAAHCVAPTDRNEPHELDIVTGRSDLKNDLVGQRLDTARVVAHPLYNSDSERYDIALIELATASAAPPIAIINASEDARWGAGKGKAAVTPDNPMIAGWGNREPDCNPPSDPCKYPAYLNEASIPLKADTVCADDGRGGSTIFDKGTMLCGGVLDTNGDPDPDATNGIDTCQGDSGGPLMIGEGTSRRLVGITSWGVGCGADTYGFYSRLQGLRVWVDCYRSTGVGGPGGPPPLVTPTGLAVGTVTAGTASLAWTPPTDGTGWTHFNVRTTTGGVTKLRATPTSGRVTLTGLTQQTTYDVEVRSAVVGCTQSDGAATATFTTPVDTVRPTKPGAPSVASRTARSVTIVWSRSRDAAGIRAYVIQEQRGGAWRNAGRIPGSRPTARISNLARGTHTFRIRAVDTNGNVSLPGRARTVSTT